MYWSLWCRIENRLSRVGKGSSFDAGDSDELKYPKRKISEAIVSIGDGIDAGFADGTLSLILEFNRASLNSGKISEECMGIDVSRMAAAKLK